MEKKQEDEKTLKKNVVDFPIQLKLGTNSSKFNINN